MANKLTPELLEKAKLAKSAEELIALAKENGAELTAEEANTYFAQLHKTGELSDDELDSVAGGCDDEPENYEPGNNRRIIDDRHKPCGNWACKLCGKTWSACRCPYTQVAHWCFDCKYILDENSIYCTY